VNEFRVLRFSRQQSPEQNYDKYINLSTTSLYYYCDLFLTVLVNMSSTIHNQQQYVWAVQSQAWRETARHYTPREHREEPKYTLISIHNTLRSANTAARAFAVDSEDLPGGGERLEEELDFIYDRGGCWVCQLNVIEYGSGNDYDIADAVVRVVRKPLVGPTQGSTLQISNTGSDNSRDHNAGKRKRPEPLQDGGQDEDGDGDDQDEVQFVKEVKR
jgi:hypothetical protein